MTDPLTGIKDILQAKGVGIWKPPAPVSASTWTITIGKLVASPDRAVSVLGTGGIESNPKFLLDYPTVMVMVRGGEQDYIESRAKIQLVKDSLLGIASHDRGGDRWVQINMIGDINPLGYDEKNRPIFSANFQLIILPAESEQSNRIPL